MKANAQKVKQWLLTTVKACGIGGQPAETREPMNLAAVLSWQPGAGRHGAG
jgi:hypothetical protein